MKKLAHLVFAATFTGAGPAVAESANKQLVTEFFELLSADQHDQAFELVDDAAAWWVPGDLPFSGTKSKAEYRAIARTIQSAFPSGFVLAVRSMIEEGDVVAAEVESFGTHANGRSYNNKYHFLMRVRDGKFIDVKEYMDTQHLAALIAP